jgi:hypothetical protein
MHDLFEKEHLVIFAKHMSDDIYGTSSVLIHQKKREITQQTVKDKFEKKLSFLQTCFNKDNNPLLEIINDYYNGEENYYGEEYSSDSSFNVDW